MGALEWLPSLDNLVLRGLKKLARREGFHSPPFTLEEGVTGRDDEEEAKM